MKIPRAVIGTVVGILLLLVGFFALNRIRQPNEPVSTDSEVTGEVDSRLTIHELLGPPGLPATLVGRDTNQLPREVEYIAGSTVGTAEEDEIGLSVLQYDQKGYLVLEEIHSRGSDGMARYKIVDAVEFDPTHFDVNMGCWHPDSKYPFGDVIEKQTVTGDMAVLVPMDTTNTDATTTKPVYSKGWHADRANHKLVPLENPQSATCPDLSEGH